MFAHYLNKYSYKLTLKHNHFACRYDSGDEGSESYHNRDVEGDQANTHVPSTSQQEKTQPPVRGSSLPENSEAAGFGSDTSPRNETGDNEELSRAERK